MLLSGDQRDKLWRYIRCGDVESFERFVARVPFWLSDRGRGGNLIDEIRTAPVAARASLLDVATRHGMNPVGLALDPAERLVVAEALRASPVWRRQAFERHIKEIYIVRAKAWGLSFVPGDGRHPVLYGGDYDGQYPATAAAVIADFKRDLERYSNGASARWFLPYLQRLANGKDHNFSLDEVIAQLPDPRAVRCEPRPGP